MKPAEQQLRQRALAVVAGVLQNPSGQILIAQRPEHGNEPGQWEFPGGKIRVGEGVQAALIRELREELGIEALEPQSYALVRWRGPPRHLNLHACLVDRWSGEPAAVEHQALRWVYPVELIRYPMPAPDRPIRARLALPRRYLITPEPGDDRENFLAQFEQAIENPDLGIASLRAKHLPEAKREALAVKFLERARCRRPDLLVLIHGEHDLAGRLGFDGVHLSSRQTLTMQTRPLPESKWVFASCHNPQELSAAERLGCDAITMSPVLPTTSHAGQSSIDWTGLATAARRTHLPCFALGGMAPADLAAACAAKAHGIAAIRSLWG